MLFLWSVISLYCERSTSWATEMLVGVAASDFTASVFFISKLRFTTQAASVAKPMVTSAVRVALRFICSPLFSRSACHRSGDRRLILSLRGARRSLRGDQRLSDPRGLRV